LPKTTKVLSFYNFLFEFNFIDLTTVNKVGAHLRHIDQVVWFTNTGQYIRNRFLSYACVLVYTVHKLPIHTNTIGQCDILSILAFKVLLFPVRPQDAVVCYRNPIGIFIFLELCHHSSSTTICSNTT
jgi:hypothetical protein